MENKNKIKIRTKIQSQQLIIRVIKMKLESAVEIIKANLL